MKESVERIWPYEYCTVSSSAYDHAWLSVVQIGTYFERDLTRSLEIYKQSSPDGNMTIKDDFDAVQYLVRVVC